MECRPFAHFALHPKPATHLLNQPGSNRQPQACPAVMACRRTIDLRESFENRLLFLGGNANAGVGNREMQSILGAIPRWIAGFGCNLHRDDNFAAWREFDRVADKVE